MSWFKKKNHVETQLTKISDQIKALPVLNERYLSLLTPMEALTRRLEEPDGDDSLVMFHMRSMGYFGGWKIRDQYLAGLKHGAAAKEKETKGLQ